MSGLPDPRDPGELRWSQLRTGAVILAGIAAVLAAIFISDTIAREISEGPRLVLTAPAARALEPGSGVWIAGVPAGRVTAIRLEGPSRGKGRPVVIRAVLREGPAQLLRTDATATIRASSLLAPSVVNIRPGTRTGQPYDFSDTLRATFQVTQEEIQARADSLVRRLEEMEPLADRLRTRLEEGPGTLARLNADTALRTRLARASETATRLMERAPRGSAARLAADTALRTTLRTALARLREAAPSPDALADTALAREMEELAARLEALRARMDAGRGTWGRVLNDQALERERALLEARMDSVRRELLADPLSLLRFRLF